MLAAPLKQLHNSLKFIETAMCPINYHIRCVSDLGPDDATRYPRYRCSTPTPLRFAAYRGAALLYAERYAYRYCRGLRGDDLFGVIQIYVDLDV